MKWMLRSMESIQKMYRVDPGEIAFLRFILEAYDGLALITTLDSKSGIVALHTSKECEDEVDMIMLGLSEEMAIEPCRLEI